MKRAFLIVLMLLVLAPPLHAADAAKGDVSKKVRELPIVKSLFGTDANVVEARDLGNLYEIVASFPGRDKQILYVTKDGAYLITGGNLINKDKANLTKERYEQVNKVDVSKLPLKDAITITKGSGAKKLYLFTDVDCPYCRKGWEWLKTQTDYTLYVYLYPLPMHPQAPEKSVKILCDKDPAGAFDTAHGDQGPAGEKCEAGEKLLQKHQTIANEVGVNSTPLFILDNGIKMSGFNQKALQDYLSKK
jgi:thiol:disulfide interchange protein DsbC